MMRLSPLLPLLAATLLIAALLGSASSTAAQPGGAAPHGVAGPAAEPVPGGPGFYTQSGLAFKPSPNNSHPHTYQGVSLYNPGTELEWYQAPVTLPQGATVTRLVAYFYDTSASQDLQLLLATGTLLDPFGHSMAYVPSAGSDAGARTVVTTIIASPRIDNQANWYAVALSLPPTFDVGLIGFRIDYEYAALAPMIRR